MSNQNKTSEQAVERLLDAVFYRTQCPPSEQLLEYHLSLLAASVQQQLQQHVELCTYCSHDLAELQAVELMPITMPAQNREPQPTLIDAVHEWLRQLIPDKPIIPGLPDLSGGLTPAMALRGGTNADSQPKQYVYNTESESIAYRISLRVTPSLVDETNIDIHGHIINQSDPDEDYTGTVHLFQAENELEQSVSDEFGFFNLEKIGIGQYGLLVELADHAIWISDVAL